MACYAYVFPCAWEDHCKIGFSHDPLARIAQLHPRWFEFFDLQSGLLVEGETERDARDLELQLRRPLAAHRAPQPLTIRAAAGGRTEWFRGAQASLQDAAVSLRKRGFNVHLPLSAWLADAMRRRCDQLFEFASARLPLDEDADPGPRSPSLCALRDALDAHEALGIAPGLLLPPHVLRWYRGAGSGSG